MAVEEPYNLEWRAQHVAVAVKDCLYIWGGNQPHLPPVHNSDLKRRLTSVVSTLRLSSGRWSSQHTRGRPPLGVRGYACTTNGTSILYFGGRCGHHQCYHNSVFSLDTLSMDWSELHPTADNSVTKRGYGGMVLVETEGSKHLLTVGGLGSDSVVVHHHHFQYTATPSNNVRTNEQNLFNLSNRKWIIPNISGQCCPPTSGFTIQNINSSKAVMFGGRVTEGGVSVPNSNMYICEVNHYTIHWENVKQPGPGEGLWPAERYRHASAVIGYSTLVMIGGADARFKPLKDGCWLFETTQCVWRKVDLPNSVSERYDHALSAFSVGPSHVWLVIVGGCLEGEQRNVGKGLKKPYPVFIHEPNVTMLIELVFTEGGWLVVEVLDQTALCSETYQWKYQSLINARQWWHDYFKNNPTESDILLQSLEHNLKLSQKDKKETEEKYFELKKCMKSLEHDLQVTQQNNNSLKEALLEADAKHQKYLEPHQKIKETPIEGDLIDDNDTSEIDKMLKTQVFEKDEMVAKLMKENLQLLEKLTLINDKSFDTKNIQCDYWTKTELPFDDMVTLGKKVCLYNANNSHELLLKECGLTLSLPDGIFSPVESTIYEAAAQGLWGGDFVFPAGTHLISSVCYVSLSPSVPCLEKPVTVQLVHCAHLTSQSQCQYLSFVVAEIQPGSQSGPFQFHLLPGGFFLPNSQIGSIKLKSFSLLAIVMGMVGGVAAGLAVTTFAGPAFGATVGATVAAGAAKLLSTNNKVPSFHCRALIYKKCSIDKLMMNLTVIQDLPSCKKLLEQDTFQALLGTEETSFRFHSPKGISDNDCLLTVENFPSNAVDGWMIKSLNDTKITVNDVNDYCDAKSAEPPYIQVLLYPGQDMAAKHRLSYTLYCSICTASTHPWSIEVSKSDLKSENPVPNSALSSTSHLSGGVECGPSEVFCKNFSLLSNALGKSFNFQRILDDFLSKKLISVALIDDVNSTNHMSLYEKASKVTRELLKKIQSSNTPQRILDDICHVLSNQDDHELKELVDNMST